MFKKFGLLTPGSSIDINIYGNQCALLVIVDSYNNLGALYLIGEGYLSTRVVKVFSAIDEQSLVLNPIWNEQKIVMALAEDYPSVCTYTLFNHRYD